jgi:photosystem II stability/assembly factor-like uncharacterized protein
MNKKHIATGLILSICIILNLINPSALSSQNTIELLWKPSNEGLNAGIITDIVIDEEQDILWASTIRAGIYRKPMASNFWESTNTGLSNHYVHCLLISPIGLFAGTDDFIFIWDGEINSWKALDIEATNISVNTMIWMNYQNKDILIAASNKGLYRSEDHGLSWSKISTANQVYKISSFAQTKSKQGYVIASAEGRWLLVSENAGISWNRVSEKPLPTEIQTLHIDINNIKVWYAGTSQQGILKSTDQGQNWIHQNKNLENIYVSKIIQNPINAELWISTFDGLFYTKPDSMDWISYQKLPFNTQVNTFSIDFSKQKVFVGTQGDSVYHSDFKDRIWHKLNENMHNAHIRVLKASIDGRFLYSATWGSGLFRSSDQGKSWSSINNGLTNPLVLCIEDKGDGTLYAGTLNGGVFKSSNAGESWDRIIAPTLFSSYIYSIAFDPLNNKRIYLGTHEGVYRSVNNGETWSKMGPGNIDQPVGNINSIAINPNDPKQIFAATNATGVYKSSDGSDTWINSSLGLPNNHITSILFHPEKSNTLYVSTFGSGVFRSNDSGASWHDINQDLNNKTVYSLFIDKNRPDVLFASTDSGLYRTLPGSTQWELFGEGLRGIPVRDAFVDSKKSIFLAGTYGNGCFLLHQMPPPPQLLEPKNNSESITLRPTMIWKEPLYYLEPVFYTIQVAEDEGFSKILYEHKGISGDQFIIPRDLLQKHRSYYWRVRSEIASGGGRWSDPYQIHLVTMIILRINQATMKVDNIEKEIDPGRGTVPLIRNNRTFLPIRTIIESVGGSIAWEESTRTVTIRLAQTIIELIIDKAEAKVNGKSQLIDPADSKVSPFVQNGRTMLPLRFVGEATNMRIEWQAETQTITLIYPDLKNG